ncbi:MAG: RsmE family RNA methyltransferase, partial [Alphaproteobacteria bacterium]
LAALEGVAPGPFGLLVGPEGGFAPDELDALARLAFVRRIGLGPRVLRAETAVVVGLALAQAAIGDLAAARSGAGVGNEHGGAT